MNSPTTTSIPVRRIKAGQPAAERAEPAPFQAAPTGTVFAPKRKASAAPTACGFGTCERSPECTGPCALRRAPAPLAPHTRTPAERELAKEEASIATACFWGAVYVGIVFAAVALAAALFKAF